MSRLGVDSIQSKKKHERHLKNVETKRDVLYRKKLLLQIWEDLEGTEHEDHPYVLGLRARVRSLENQYRNMRPISDEEFD